MEMMVDLEHMRCMTEQLEEENAQMEVSQTSRLFSDTTCPCHRIEVLAGRMK